MQWIMVIIQVVKFIFGNWSTIKKLISELQKIFGGDNKKVAECLEGVCEAAKEIHKEPIVKPKKKRGGIFRRR